MKLLSRFFVLFLLSSQAAFAQISVDDGQGSQVTIGPGGININKSGYGVNKNVRIGMPGVRVSAPPARPVRQSVNVVTSADASLATQVGMIEQSVNGHKNEGMALAARVQKLEVDNLGKKGSGALKVRVARLAKELGVNITVTAVPVTTQTHTTVIPTGVPVGSINVVDAGSVAEIVVNDNNVSTTYDCHGNGVVINGNNCTLYLRGNCAGLVINGNDNTIKGDHIVRVIANGNNNQVSYPRTTAPRYVNNGSGNHFRPQ